MVDLVKSGDREAQPAAEKVDALHKQYQRLQRVVEQRIHVALVYVSFHKQCLLVGVRVSNYATE